MHGLTLASAFEQTLRQRGLHAALGLLNAATPYRLTGVYRFDGDLVRSVALFDRKNPLPGRAVAMEADPSVSKSRPARQPHPPSAKHQR